MTIDRKVIHVGLYGGKGLFGEREKPLEVSIIHCEMFDRCSFYKEDQCAAIRSLNRDYCKYGEEETKRGFTSRAMKYHEFKNKWESHEKYAALTKNTKGLALIGDEVFFSYPYIRIAYENDNYVTKEPFMQNGSTLIPICDFDENFIYKICKFEPHALMGGTISEYKEEVVPRFLGHLKELLPDLYNSFIEKHKEFDKDIDYVGRKAYLHTVNKGTFALKKRDDIVWNWDGEYLQYEKGNLSTSLFIGIRNHDELKIKVKPHESQSVEITDNSQVNENTEFID